MRYSKRYKRCKLKEEFLTSTNKRRCQQFDQIPKSIQDRKKKQDKATMKKKDAKYCIGCLKNQEGFCLTHQRWAFNVRGICKEMKTKVV